MRFVNLFREKYWDLKEWWFFRRSPIRNLPPAEPRTVTNVEGIRLVNVHHEDHCRGRACVVHNPTDHALRGWRLHWRNDRGIFERMCPQHGCGHPDPDQFDYWNAIGKPEEAVHGCCGCCRINYKEIE